MFIVCLAPMRWSFCLIQVPAYIVDVWLFLYRLVLLVVSLALFFISLTILALAAFGIRWGW